MLPISEHYINTHKMHQHTNIASIPEHCINTPALYKQQKMHQHPNISSTPEVCINTEVLYQLHTITSEHFINN